MLETFLTGVFALLLVLYVQARRAAREIRRNRSDAGYGRTGDLVVARGPSPRRGSGEADAPESRRAAATGARREAGVPAGCAAPVRPRARPGSVLPVPERLRRPGTGGGRPAGGNFPPPAGISPPK